MYMIAGNEKLNRKKGKSFILLILFVCNVMQLLTIGSAGFILHNSVSPFSKVGVTVLVR